MPPRVKAPRRRSRSLGSRILVRLLRVLALAIAGSVLAVVALRWIPPPTTGVMIERRVSALWGGRPYRADYRWVPWQKISPNAGLAVVAAEDQNFPTHHGCGQVTRRRTSRSAAAGSSSRWASSAGRHA